MRLSVPPKNRRYTWHVDLSNRTHPDDRLLAKPNTVHPRHAAHSPHVLMPLKMLPGFVLGHDPAYPTALDRLTCFLTPTRC